MDSLRILALLCVLTVPDQAVADDNFEIAKAFAGAYSTDKQLGDQMQRNVRSKEPIPEYSVIECKQGQRFGVGYVIVFSNTAPANFEVVWEYPHLSEVEGDLRDVHQVTHRRPKKYAYDFGAEVRVLKKKHRIDGDFVVTLRRDEKILLRHVFHIRGCDVPA